MLAAARGNNTLNPEGNNGNKEQSGSSSDKDNNKYTFTLFSFFSATDTSLKSDSLQTEPKRKAEKGMKESN